MLPFHQDLKNFLNLKEGNECGSPQNEEISQGRKNRVRKKSVLLSAEKKQIGGAHTIKKEREKELLTKMLTPSNQCRIEARRERRLRAHKRIGLV